MTESSQMPKPISGNRGCRRKALATAMTASRAAMAIMKRSPNSLATTSVALAPINVPLRPRAERVSSWMSNQ